VAGKRVAPGGPPGKKTDRRSGRVSRVVWGGNAGQQPATINLTETSLSVRELVHSARRSADSRSHHGFVGRALRRRGGVILQAAAGSGFQPAMVRAQIRVFSLLARPGNSRHSSTAAASSPPCS
jgi:hypothetical protein